MNVNRLFVLVLLVKLSMFGIVDCSEKDLILYFATKSQALSKVRFLVILLLRQTICFLVLNESRVGVIFGLAL